MDEPLGINKLGKGRKGPWDNSEKSNVYKVNVEEDVGGELYIDLPRELIS